MKIFIVSLALSPTVAMSYAQERRPMSSMERSGMERVADECSTDVALLCDRDPFAGSLLTPLFSASPVFSSFFEEPTTTTRTSYVSHSPLDELDSFVEQFFQLPVTVGTSIVMVGPSNEEEGDEDDGWEEVSQTVNDVVDGVASLTHPEDMDQLSQRLVDHGWRVLESDDSGYTATQRRMARRLTEAASSVDDLLSQRRLALPFGHPRRNQCLREAHERGAVAPSCNAAIKSLDKIRAHEFTNMHKRGCELSAYLLGFMLMIVLISILSMFRHKRGEERRLRRLRWQILRAVYSRPDIKHAVEKELGESIGFVPPVAFWGLRSFGAESVTFRKQLKDAFRCRKFVILASIFLVIIAPKVLFAAYGLLFAFCLVKSAIGGKDKRLRVCTCCCCGTSTEDAKNGIVADPCCSCCQGLGVCSPGCASCCGPSSRKNGSKFGDGCCCGSTCNCGSKGVGVDCSSGSKCGTSAKVGANVDCTCCCCGTTTADVRKGHVSEAGACCNCCQGLGVCSPSCASCCGPSKASKSSGGNVGCCCGSACCCGLEENAKPPKDFENIKIKGHAAAALDWVNAELSKKHSANCGPSKAGNAGCNFGAGKKCNNKECHDLYIPVDDSAYTGVPIQVV